MRFIAVARVAVAALIVAVLPTIRKRREVVFHEEEELRGFASVGTTPVGAAPR